MSTTYQPKDTSQPAALILIILMLLSSIATSMPQALPDAEESLSTTGRTGNETINVTIGSDSHEWNTSANASITLTGLSSTISYDIEWKVCYRSTSGVMQFNDCYNYRQLREETWNQSNQSYEYTYIGGNVSVPSGVSSLSTSVQFEPSYNTSSNLNRYGFYIVAELQSSGYSVDDASDGFTYGHYGYVSITDYSQHSGDIVLGDTKLFQIESCGFRFYSAKHTTVWELVNDDTGAQVNSSSSNNWTAYNCRSSGYAEIATQANTNGSNGSGAGGYWWGPTGAGNFTLWANISHAGVQTDSESESFRVMDLGLTGNESMNATIGSDSNEWNTTATVYLNVSGLNTSVSYDIEWKVCYRSTSGVMQFNDCYNYRQLREETWNQSNQSYEYTYIGGNVSVPSGVSSLSTSVQFEPSYNTSSNLNRYGFYIVAELQSSGYSVDDASDGFTYGHYGYVSITDYSQHSGDIVLGDTKLFQIESCGFRFYSAKHTTVWELVNDDTGAQVNSSSSNNWTAYNCRSSGYAEIATQANTNGSNGSGAGGYWWGPTGAGNFTLWANISHAGVQTDSESESFRVMILGIDDNSTMDLITETGTPGDGLAWANFSFAEQDVDEWYTVVWNLSDSSGQELDSDDFGWMAISNSYSKDVPFTNLDEGTYCVDATLYVGTDYVQDTNQSCFTIELPDADGDGVSDLDDWCANTPVGESVDVNGCAESQKDDDSDGVMNDVDQCPDTVQGSTVDVDGCSSDQLDDDGDGVSNLEDLCPGTPTGETVDADGCSGSQLDDDSDGVSNDADLCPGTVAGTTVDSDGCSQQQLLDSDNDGVNNQDDLCSNTPGNEVADSNGCSPSQLDSDGDGISDADDQCPDTPAGVTVDSDGCPSSVLDSDGDGITDIDDQCPNTSQGATVDNDGCAQSQLDDDEDGVSNDADLCAGTATGDAVDADGCSAQQLDPDGDGVLDSLDLCTGTPAGESVDADGCAASQLDSDVDGITNDIDLCPATVTGETVDTDGCSDNQRDSDGDGVVDAIDVCPSDAGTQADGCPVNQPPTCDIYYSLESNGMLAMGDAAISSVGGAAGIIPVPVGKYYIVAVCEDPDGDMVNATITTPLGVHSESATSVKVGALIHVTEDMKDTIPVSLVWDDGKDSYHATFIIELGADPAAVAASSSGSFVPGFSLLSAIGVLCFVAIARRISKLE